MRTEIVSFGSVTAVVRARTRRTAMLEAIYKTEFLKIFPEIATLSFNGNLEASAANVVLQHPAAWERYNNTNEFSALAARIAEVTGMSFVCVNGQFAPGELLKAYDDFLDDESGFWAEVAEGIVKMEQSIAPLEQQATATLPKELQNDPN